MYDTPMYSIREVIQSTIDLDFIREKPLSIRSGKHYLIAMPVYFYQHPEFIKDFYMFVKGYKEIFTKCDWMIEKHLTSLDESMVDKFVDGVTLFSNSMIYKKFINQGLPAFLTRWAKTMNTNVFGNTKIVNIKKSKARKLFSNFQVDELIKVFYGIYYFNYDNVKKNLASLEKDILKELTGSSQTMEYSGTTKKKDYKMPTLLNSPLTEQELKLLRTQSMQSD